jgi:hypothetical protein
MGNMLHYLMVSNTWYVYISISVSFLSPFLIGCLSILVRLCGQLALEH